MKQTRLLMGMPITVEVLDPRAGAADLNAVFAYFGSIDETFSTYKASSEVSRINRGELAPAQYSDDMRTILALAEQTKRETNGYFDIECDGQIDPSGIVKGWAIRNAAQILAGHGFRDYYVDAGGDAQIGGTKRGTPWRVGIRNPFNRDENVKILALTECGIATSGTAIRGQHIYNPHQPHAPLLDIVSLSVIGPDVYEADRFATAAFAMGARGISFIERRPGLEGYQIDRNGIATFTSGFERFALHP
jgi:thiamine biosynthesis lipoprotein